MLKINSPTKKLKEIRNKLGSEYSIRVIDLEQVIYRKINDSYDIEISGLNDNRKTFRANIYVWKLTPGKQIIENIQDIPSIENLNETLSTIYQKYA